MARSEGVVYLLHFIDPATRCAARYRHAGHYVGFTPEKRLEIRLAEHAAGHGARLVQVIIEAGLTFELARTWPGGRDRERQIKRQGGASRFCPLCGITPMAPRTPKVAAVLPAVRAVAAYSEPPVIRDVFAELAAAARAEHDAVAAEIAELAFTETPPPCGWPAWHPWHVVSAGIAS